MSDTKDVPDDEPGQDYDASDDDPEEQRLIEEERRRLEKGD